MAIDKERLNRLHIESRDLLESVADRLTPEKVRIYRSFSFAGEWALLADGLCATLVKRQIPVTAAERDALASVLGLFQRPHERYNYLNDPAGTLAALNVVDGSTP